MYVGEIPDNANLEFHVESGDKEVTLISVAHVPNNPTDEKLFHDFLKKYRYGSGILAEPIVRKRKYVSFHNLSARLSVLAVCDSTPYVWTDLKIITANFRKDTYYLIMSNQNAGPSNRRASFRQWVGMDGSLRRGLDPHTTNVIIKDISTTGIGVIAPPNFQPRIGEVVQINYSDRVSNGSVFPKEFNFSLSASVAREGKNDKNQTILGCRFLHPDDSLNQYINMKQTEHNRTSSVRRPQRR